MSLPSITTLPCFPSWRCFVVMISRIIGCAATIAAPRLITSILSWSVIFLSSTKTSCPPSLQTSSILVFNAISATASLSSSAVFFCKLFQAIDRYIDPVSMYRKFNFLATIFATVLFPLPAGPSIAIIMRGLRD